MMDTPPSLVSCGACGKVHWLRGAIEGEPLPGRDEPHSDDQRVWAHAPYIAEAKAAEIVTALAEGFAADPEEEFDARRLAWWDENHAERSRQEIERYSERLPLEDPRRNRHPGPPAALSEVMAHNLERLLELLHGHDDDEEHLLKAEILRALGRYDEALVELRFAFFTEGTAEASFRQQIESHCEKNNPGVFRVEFSEQR